MALQFIFGNSICGKSEYMYQVVIEQAKKHPKWNYLFVVPEQATLLVQRELIGRHPEHALGNIDVLSFQRFAYRIFDELSVPMLNILDDTGKAMILRKVAEEHKSEMNAFRKNLSQSGFIQELKSMISELYQYGVGDVQLNTLVSQTNRHPLLQLKLQDLSIVYTAFQKKLKNEYITAEELLTVLCHYIEQSKFIKNSIILLDGFTGFTPIQYQVLELLMIYAKHIVCSVTVGSGTDPYQKMESHELFYMSHVIVEKLREMAIQNHIAYGKDKTVPKTWECSYKKQIYSYEIEFTQQGSLQEAENTINKTELQKADMEKNQKEKIRQKKKKIRQIQEERTHMEQQIFRYPSMPWKKEVQSQWIYSAKNPEQEVQFVLQEIMRLVREEGYLYREIGIVTGDLSIYEPILTHQFTEAGISFFIDQKKNLSRHPLAELVRSVVAVISHRFSYESILSYLRNPFVPIDRNAVDEVENYVVATGIRGKKAWETEWTRGYRGFQKGQLEKINQTRERIMEPLRILMDAEPEQGKWTVRERTKSLFYFMDHIQIEEQLQKMADQFGQDGEFQRQKEYEQTYKKVLDLFDQMVELMGEEEVSAEEYGEILDSGLEDIQVGLIPVTIDRLVAGDLMRTRLGNVRTLFVLGVNDGLLPRNGEKGGILSEQDRELIRNLDVELAPTAKEDAFTQKLYIYLMLTKPTEQLYLCYSRLDRNGKAIRPSYLISTVKKLFPNLKEEAAEQKMGGLQGLQKPKNSFRILIDGMRQYLNGEECTWWEELYRWYRSNSEYEEKINQILSATFYSYKKEAISKAIAKRLFWETPMNSVTRLEKFASCAYAHFLAYGLDLEPRVLYQLAAVDYGNIFHKSIEAFFGKVKEKKLDWTNLTVTQRMQNVNESVQEVANDYGNTILQSSARNQYMVQRMERMTDRTIWALAEQWKEGSFEQSLSEAGFTSSDELEGMKLPLEEGVTMALQGRIDRVDVAEDGDHVYVKVIDYKSGNTDFDLTKIYHGLQLQLIIYLEAALEMEKKKHPDKTIVPAGIYYYHIKDPIVEQENAEDEKAAQKAVKRELRMSGLTNSEPEILDRIDHSGNKKSEIIKNLERNDNGSASKRSLVADSTQMQQLCQFGLKKATKLGNEMISGNIAVNPYEYKKMNSCEYCEFKSICGFDSRLEGYGYRRLQKMKPDEMWEVLEKIEEMENQN